MLCGVPLAKQLEINDWTHQNGVHFVATETRGLFGCVAAFIRTVSSAIKLMVDSAPSSMTSALDSPAWMLLENNHCPE